MIVKILVITNGDYSKPSSRYRIYEIFSKLNQSKFLVKIIPAKNIVNTNRSLIDFTKDIDILILQRYLNIRATEIRKIRKNGKKVIFDFDDALYAVPSAALVKDERLKLTQMVLEKIKSKYRVLAYGNKQYTFRKILLDNVIKNVDMVISANNTLSNYASKLSANVYIIPTTVDTENIPIKKHYDKYPVVLGWIGTNNNLFYLDKFMNCYLRILNQYNGSLQLKVVSGKGLKWSTPYLINKFWNFDTEVNDLCSFDIGIMPLTDDEWAKGKSAFKAIYYSAIGLPVVASAIGVNNQIINHGVTGFLAESEKDWEDYINLLYKDFNLRKILGKNGRICIEEKYSLRHAVKLWETMLINI